MRVKHVNLISERETCKTLILPTKCRPGEIEFSHMVTHIKCVSIYVRIVLLIIKSLTWLALNKIKTSSANRNSFISLSQNWKSINWTTSFFMNKQHNISVTHVISFNNHQLILTTMSQLSSASLQLYQSKHSRSHSNMLKFNNLKFPCIH